MLNVDHVRQLGVEYEVRNEIETRRFDPGELYEADRRNLRVNVVLWDVMEGDLAWEAAGSSTTRDAEYELPRSFLEWGFTATRPAEQISLARGEPAGEDTAPGG